MKNAKPSGARPEIDCYMDGCCEPVNPGGTAAYGAVVFIEGERVWETSKVFKPKPGHERETSNNVAEYLGFIAVLEYLLQQRLNGKVIRISSDSRLVINQMFPRHGRTWKIRAGLYVPHAHRARKLLKKFPRTYGRWIPRDDNEIADELSKRELKRAGVEFRLQPEENDDDD